MNINNTNTTYFQLHFIELKYNFFLTIFTYIYIFSVCYYFSDQLIFICIEPLLKLKILKYLIYTDITEVFFLNFTLASLISILIYLPFFLIQIWYFFLKGLTILENIKILKFHFFFNILNCFIIYIIFIKIIPYLWIYFYYINISTDSNYLYNIHFEPRLNNYFIFLFNLYIYIYLLCIYPFIIYILILFNILKIETFFIFRNIIYLKILIIATCITPPDIWSQLGITIPLILFFELYIFLYIYYKKYKK